MQSGAGGRSRERHPARAWQQRLAGAASPLPAKRRIESLQIDGTLAAVKARATFATFEFIDRLLLLKIVRPLAESSPRRSTARSEACKTCEATKRAARVVSASMKHARAAALLFSTALAASAAADDRPQIEPVRASVPPAIDGRLDDAVWQAPGAAGERTGSRTTP